MTMFYSPNTGGFYADSFKPSDAIELGDEEYTSLVANQRGYGFTVKDGVVMVAEPLEPPVKTPEQMRVELESKRDVLLGAAGLRINPLQDSVDLGKAIESDLAALKVWKQYRVDVNRVDLSLEGVIWPPLPE